jgi:hypothetical protein
MKLKKEYQVFIREMIKHGDERKAYKKAYPNTTKEDAIRKGCHRLSQNVTVQAAIRTEAEKIQAIATQEAITELKEEIKAEVLTAAQKREILFKIANGLLEIPTKKPVWDHMAKKYVFVPMLEIPDHAARMKAIELDNKMSGDIAPSKHELTGKDGKPIQSVATLKSNVDVTQLPDNVLHAILKARVKTDE